MQQRKANKLPLYLLSLVIASLAMLGVAGNALAADTNPTVVIDALGQICPAYGGLTARFAICIQNTIGWAVNNYLGEYFFNFVMLVNAICVLAVVFFGIFVLMGRTREVTRSGIILAVKIGFVIFLINFGAFIQLFPALIDIINWMVSLVTGYTAIQMSPHCPYNTFIWHRLDCALNMLIGGIFTPTNVSYGFAGFVIAMLFSKSIGLAVFFFGAAIIMSTLLAVMHALFILLSAYIALALLALIAPLVIPLILFQQTKAYFDKWLRMTIGVMLQPVFLFAYLTLFLIALEVSIFSGPYSIYRSIACDRVDNPNFSMGQYILNNGQLQERAGAEALWSMVVGQGTEDFAGTPDGAEQQPGGIAGDNAVREAGAAGADLFGNGVTIDLSVDALNIEQLANSCQMDPGTYMVRMVLSFFAAAAVIYIFYTMLQVIPYLGTLISGDLFGLPNLSNLIPSGSIQGKQFMTRLGFGSGRGGL